MKKTNLKLAAAAVGAGALIAMGGLTMATTSSAEPAVPGPVPTEEATIGESTVANAPQEEPSEDPTAISVAPEIRGPAPLPSEEQGLPGS